MKNTKISKRGLNATIKATIAKNPNANPAEMDKALKEVAKAYGMKWRDLQDWMVDHLIR